MLIKITLVLALLGLGFGSGWHFRPTDGTIIMKPEEEPIVMRTNGGLLEVSTINATEVFQRTTHETIFKIPLPWPTTSEIRAKATYRYHVALAPEWKFIRRENTIVVIAPPVKPSLPVAIDTATVEAKANGIWSVITGGAAIQALQKEITASLAQKAAHPTYIKLQREHARKTVNEFVKKWVLSQDKWKNQSYSIQVFFSDESLDVIQKKDYFPIPISRPTKE